MKLNANSINGTHLENDVYLWSRLLSKYRAVWKINRQKGNFIPPEIRLTGLEEILPHRWCSLQNGRE